MELMQRSTHHPTGFTLIELMITIAVLAIIASLAAPSVGVFVSRSAMRGISADFTLAMQRARSEAINRNMCVAVCMSNNPTATAPKCYATGQSWGVGWIVFTLPNCAPSIGTSMPTPPEEVILVHEALNPRYQLNNMATRRSVVFSSRGSLRAGFSGFNLVDTGVSANDPINRTLCLDRAGRINVLDFGSTCS